MALILVPILMFGFLAAIFLSDNYGMTWDDQGLWNYADHTIETYHEALQGHFIDDPGPGNLRYYGPAFLTFERLGENALISLFPQLDRLAIWHFAIFTIFLVGLASLYSIAAKLFPPHVAFSATLLFALQPLIWGHAFINGKDMPFLSFFLLSIALGIKMADVIPEIKRAKRPQKTLADTVREDWQHVNTRVSDWLIRIFAFLVILSLGLIFFPNWAESWIRGLIQYAAANPSSPLGALFQSLASNVAGVPLENYVQKTLTFFQLVNSGTVLLSWLLLFVYAVRIFSKTRKGIAASFGTIRLKASGAYWKTPVIWWAGLALALATATRVVAPFAAGLVIYYLLNKRGLPAILASIPYLLIAALGTYLLWPYLWYAPFARLWQSLTVMSNFPQPGIALFNGQIIPVGALPFFYLPELILIQITLPALLFIFVGLWLYARQKVSQDQKSLARMLLLWFGLPLAYGVLLTPSMYDNFRQYLFAIPPLFVLAGFSFQWLSNAIRNATGYWTAVIFICLFGIIAIVQLHPYEYIYYNELVGGVRGASTRFEMDYWATALTESTLQLNQLAPQNSRVVVWGQELIVRQAARGDLLVEGNRGGTYDPETGYDYAIINLGPTRPVDALYPDANIVAAVSRAGVPLAVVKQLHPEVGESE